MNGLTASHDEMATPGTKVVNALLACGIVSSVLYVGGEILASTRWIGYSYVNQAVSELAAIGAPTRPFMVAMFSVYNVLVLAFAAGVWASAGRKRALRVSAIALAVYAVVGEVTTLFSPMQLRGSTVAATDVGHMVLTAVEVVSVVSFIAFGSGARGKGFRVYSIVTILLLVAAGIITGAVVTHMTAQVASTPWAGILERVNIYSTMLWVAVLAVVLMRTRRERAGTEGADSPAEGRRVKNVVAFVGSAHKGGATHTAARRFLDHLESFRDVRGEIVALSDHDIRTCRGCKACFERGEEHCPLKDDRDVLIGKMAASDAVVFASPNYSFQVSGMMKAFLDRLGFLFHRPRFHGKTATAVVVQGVYGGRRIRKYLEFVGGGLGFNVVRGSVVRTLEPMSEEALRTMDDSLAKQSRRFHDRLFRPAYPTPSLFGLAVFRMSRTGVRTSLGPDALDHAYYHDQGWFASDYYYPTHLGPLKRAFGAFFDRAAARTSAFRVADEAAGAPRHPSSKLAPR